MNTNFLKWLNTIALVFVLVVNMLANLLPIGVGNTGKISKMYPNLFTPSGMTFSIWGVIYFCMVAFVLYQWGIFDHGAHSEAIRNVIGPWFAISCLLNVGWIFAWHYNKIGISVFLMFALLLSLVMIMGRLALTGHDRWSFWMVGLGFDLYFGWIIAASIANVNVWLTSIGWQRFGLSEISWTIVLLLLGSVITYAVVLWSGRQLIGLPVIWAYAGILQRHISPQELNGEYPSVIIFTFVGIVIILMSIFIFSDRIGAMLYESRAQVLRSSKN